MTRNMSAEFKAAEREILRKRAAAIASEPQSARAPEAALEVVEFGLAHERYAVEAAHVREVVPLDNLTPLPGTPGFVAGLVNVRGRILAVIDIRQFFDLPLAGITDAHQILILGRGKLEFGILTDTVRGMRSVALAQIQTSLPTLTGVREGYLKGVTAERLVILDAAAIMADPRIFVDEEAEQTTEQTKEA